MLSSHTDWSLPPLEMDLDHANSKNAVHEYGAYNSFTDMHFCMLLQVVKVSVGLAIPSVCESLGILQTAMQQLKPSAAVIASETPAQLCSPAVSNGTSPADSASMAIAGSQALLRTAMQERPHGIWSSLSIHDLASSQLSVQAASAAAADGTIVSGTAYQPRMLPHHGSPSRSRSALPKGNMQGNWAITGGLGSIGMLAAEWVAASGHAGCLWLLSRTAHSFAAAHMARHPTAHFTIYGCDIATAADASGWCQSQTQNGANPLVGLVHAGGVLRDALLPKQSPSGLQEVAAGKVNGGLQLCSVAGSAPLTDTVLFSSTAALLGPPGQANYAAANAMLNHLSDTQAQAGKHLDCYISCVRSTAVHASVSPLSTYTLMMGKWAHTTSTRLLQNAASGPI